MSARSGFVGKNPPGPVWGHPKQFFQGPEKSKNVKILPIFLGGPMGPIHPVWALAAIHPRWGNRYLILEGLAASAGLLTVSTA